MKFNLWSEYRFRVLWYFIAFVFGIALYFGLPREPNLIMCSALALILCTAAYFRKAVWIKLAFFFVFGVFIATLRTSFIDTEFLWKSQWNKEISGEVSEAFSTHVGQIVVLENIKAKIPFVPKRARFTFKEKTPHLRVGDFVSFKGHLYGPQAHQAQRFFYQGLSAQGQIVQMLSHKVGPERPFEDLRLAIMERLRAVLTPSQAEIAIPLIVGEQRVVSEEVYSIFRRAGIAHVLSVSGFHMVLLAGFVFFLIRGFLALIPYLALRVSSKKIAAVIALFVTGFYLLISGLQVPAIRSFMMIALVFLGVLTDRKVMSLYTLLLVAFAVLLFRPEWITSVSFQFSFIAVLVLVGVFEDVCRLLPKGLFFRVVVTAVLANIFVTLALGPFVIYHFNQFNPYGMLGNLLTSILFSFFIMPALFIGSVLMPFGWDAPFLKMAGFMLDQVMKLAGFVADLKGSEIIIPSFSGWGLMLITFGIIIICVLKRALRWWGVVLIVIGFGLGYVLADRPDIIVTDKGRVVLVRAKNGNFRIKGKTSWQAERWLRQNGQTNADSLKSKAVELKGYQIALSSSKCDKADLAILSRENKECKAKDVFVPKRRAGYKIYLRDSILIESEDRVDRHRPWGVQFKRKEKK